MGPERLAPRRSSGPSPRDVPVRRTETRRPAPLAGVRPRPDDADVEADVTKWIDALTRSADGGGDQAVPVQTRIQRSLAAPTHDRPEVVQRLSLGGGLRQLGAAISSRFKRSAPENEAAAVAGPTPATPTGQPGSTAPGTAKNKRSVRWHHSLDDDVRGQDMPERYFATLSKGEHYLDEDIETMNDPALRGALATVTRLHQAGQSYDDYLPTFAAIGWSPDDVKARIEEFANTGVAPVKYLSDEERQQYQVHGGTTLAYGPSKATFDTSTMQTNSGGPGFAVFVLDEYGRIFAGSHKQGLFHHSSFLAGQKAACAGEMKVVGGKIVELTNKTGHYRATPAELQVMLAELFRRGVDIYSMQLTFHGPPDKLETAVAEYVRRGYDLDKIRLRVGDKSMTMAEFQAERATGHP